MDNLRLLLGYFAWFQLGIRSDRRFPWFVHENLSKFDRNQNIKWKKKYLRKKVHQTKNSENLSDPHSLLEDMNCLPCDDFLGLKEWTNFAISVEDISKEILGILRFHYGVFFSISCFCGNWSMRVLGLKIWVESPCAKVCWIYYNF